MSDMLKVKRLLDLAAIEMDMPDSQQVAEFLIINGVTVVDENAKIGKLKAELTELRNEMRKLKGQEAAFGKIKKNYILAVEESSKYKRKYAQKCGELERLKKKECKE